MKERSYSYKAKPKVFTISIFPPEGEVWWGIPEFDLLATSITVPGFSPLFPDAHCTAEGDICHLVTGESGGCLFPIGYNVWDFLGLSSNIRSAQNTQPKGTCSILYPTSRGP